MTIGRDMTHIKTKKIHLRIFDSGLDDPSEDFLVKCVMSRPWVIIKVLYDTATKKISISFKEEMALISALVTFHVQNQEKNINKILSVEQLYDC